MTDNDQVVYDYENYFTLEDGTVITKPDEHGRIRHVCGEQTVEARNPGDEGYEEWHNVWHGLI